MVKFNVKKKVAPKKRKFRVKPKKELKESSRNPVKKRAKPAYKDGMVAEGKAKKIVKSEQFDRTKTGKVAKRGAFDARGKDPANFHKFMMGGEYKRGGRGNPAFVGGFARHSLIPMTEHITEYKNY